MKSIKIISCLIILLLVSSCASPSGDMLNNKFTSLISAQPPKDVCGLWSGTMGPYLATIKIREDGNGLMAYSYGTSNVLSKVKYQSDGKLYFQDGTKVEITIISPTQINLFAPYLLGHTSKFFRDEQLKEAPLFAIEDIKKF